MCHVTPCLVCGQHKAPDDYPGPDTGHDGRTCYACLMTRARYLRKMRAYHRAWRKRNPDRYRRTPLASPDLT